MSNDIPWMVVAHSLIGTKEYGKKSSNPDILQWAQLAEIAGYTDDDIPWCGLFVAHCMAESGIEYVEKPLWARNWANFGQKLDDPAYGAVMTFARGNGGHVGFYVGDADKKHFNILGGNQSDAVTIAKIEKKRLLAITWPTRMLARLDEDHPEDDGDYKLSKDEA